MLLLYPLYALTPPFCQRSLTNPRYSYRIPIMNGAINFSVVMEMQASDMKGALSELLVHGGLGDDAAALEALRSGRKDMLAMKAEYRDRRNVIVKRLNEMGLKCFLPEGAFYVFPNITSSGLSSNDFAVKLLMEKKVAVVPGTAFGACGEGFIRCSYATSMEGIKEAMDKMEEFLRSLKKKNKNKSQPSHRKRKS